MVNFDQAEGLRRMLFGVKPRFVTFLSALSNQERNATLVNLAAGLANMGHEVVLLDARENGASAARWLEIAVMATLVDVAKQKYSFDDATIATTQGFKLASMSRAQHSTADFHINDVLLTKLNKIVSTLGKNNDIVLVDGELNDNNALACDVLADGEIVIQLTNQADSIKQAYGLIKRAHTQFGRRHYGVLVTGVTESEAHKVFDALAKVASNFLSVPLNFVGFVPEDDYLRRASRSGRNVIEAFPGAGAAAAFSLLAHTMTRLESAASHF